ncbi:MAG: hypothetical protein U9P14_02390, partial [Gemmatimonadota bacterium]|nr:hypothetical protein [Gemmatimonadota bacterium]
MRFKHVTAMVLMVIFSFTSLASGSSRRNIQGHLGQVSYEVAGDRLILDNGTIGLNISRRLQVRPALLEDGRQLSFVSERGSRPAFHARFSGFDITDFLVDWDRLEVSQIEDELGAGVRFEIPAISGRYGLGDIRIEVMASLALYEKFPAVVISGARFINLSRQTVRIDRLVGNYYRLDRRLLNPGSPAWRFASYHGAAYKWGEDYSVIRIEGDFEQKNFMGLKDRSDSEGNGGGTPLVDLWAPEMGMAIASAEPSPQWISLPVRTCSDGLVEMYVMEEPEADLGQKATLGPGESCSTIRSALILHRLDFHDPLRTYADLLRAQGIGIPLSSPPEAYIPYWKSWGFRKDFTLEQIYRALPQLKRIGVLWANLDDGWFTWYGDWEPNPAPGKFPGGEADMRAFVKRLHRQGFK